MQRAGADPQKTLPSPSVITPGTGLFLPTLPPSQADGWYQEPILDHLGGKGEKLACVRRAQLAVLWWPSGTHSNGGLVQWVHMAKGASCFPFTAPLTLQPTRALRPRCLPLGCPPGWKRTTKIQLPVPFLLAFAAACLWRTGAG